VRRGAPCRSDGRGGWETGCSFMGAPEKSDGGRRPVRASAGCRRVVSSMCFAGPLPCGAVPAVRFRPGPARGLGAGAHARRTAAPVIRSAARSARARSAARRG
jgi:hypothetical protein